MKKIGQGSRRSVSCDNVPFKTNRSSSLKCKTGSKAEEKIERQRISRVRFKENVGNSVKTSKSVQFVRNTEQPVKKTRSLIHFKPSLQDKLLSLEQLSVDSKLQSESGVDLKFDVPELCTSLRVANKLLDEAALESKSDFGKNSLKGVSSSDTIKSKVLQKVNIPFEEQIYKNLVDLKVSDNDLHYGQDKRIKSKHFERIKDKEPELSEFYEPSFNEEYVLKIEKLQIDPLKMISYDGFSISDRMKNWQIS
ncbi:uncharacterized protein LOC142317358 isoform X2 [Lycorma delicatula]|uniref:uncharacterized protein LOC142317358 isoform X2 n=1 Tax=Lycorma delicatula TaxID=130591 RepID=UPI003F50F92F